MKIQCQSVTCPTLHRVQYLGLCIILLASIWTELPLQGCQVLLVSGLAGHFLLLWCSPYSGRPCVPGACKPNLQVKFAVLHSRIITQSPESANLANLPFWPRVARSPNSIIRSINSFFSINSPFFVPSLP